MVVFIRWGGGGGGGAFWVCIKGGVVRGNDLFGISRTIKQSGLAIDMSYLWYTCVFSGVFLCSTVIPKPVLLTRTQL